MFERDYLPQVRQALRAAGIWGSASTRLTEQLADHYHETVAALKAKGCADDRAHKDALTVLGTPRAIANAAAEALPAQSVLARHPWWIGTAAFPTVFAIFLLIAIPGYHLAGFPAYLESKDAHDFSFPTLAVFVSLANWLPLVTCLSLLGWAAWKQPTGWNALFIVGGAIGVAAGALTIQVTPPLHGFGSGYFVVAFESWISLVRWLIPPWHRPENFPAGLDAYSFLKLLLPSALCLGLRLALQRRDSNFDPRGLSPS